MTASFFSHITEVCDSEFIISLHIERFFIVDISGHSHQPIKITNPEDIDVTCKLNFRKDGINGG
jgi:hypothetical protein